MTSKKKEDRSDWVAVEPEFANAGNTSIRKAQSAYAYFQAAVTTQVKEQVTRESANGKFDIAVFGRAVRDRWNTLPLEEKQIYVDLAQRDAARYAQESHQADVEALQRAEKLRQERDQVYVEGSDDLLLDGTRTTRRKLDKKRKKQHKNESANPHASAGSSEASDSSDSLARPIKVPRQISQKQQDYIAAKKEEKLKKEQYITGRQEDLRKERAEQANRRLEYLLKQSNIFSHFGSIKQDALKYGAKSGTVSKQTALSTYDSLDESQRSSDRVSSRRDAARSNDDDDLDALEEADEHEAIYLTKQPSTLGHGQMRDYQ
jgi:hypothetical protein